MQTSRWVGALATLALAAPTFAAAQDGLRIRVDATEIQFTGRVQAQFNTTSVDGLPPTEMLLRRVRFGANIRVNETVSGRIHPEFAGSAVTLADAYMQIDVADALSLMAGKAHRPFGIIEQASSNQIAPIERGVRIRGVDGQELSSILSGLRYSDREVGFQLRGAPEDAPLGLTYAFGIFAGPLQGSVGDNLSQQYVARLGFRPFDDVSIAAAWSRRDFAREVADDDFQIEGGNALLADLTYGGLAPEPGLHVVAEAAMGDYDPFRDQEFMGAQVWAGFRAEAGRRITLVEPLVRVSFADIDPVAGQEDRGGLLVTPGLNIYFGGLNRLLLNYDIWQGENDADESSFKAQFQFVF